MPFAASFALPAILNRFCDYGESGGPLNPERGQNALATVGKMPLLELAS
jgi:hypothetical protein